MSDNIESFLAKSELIYIRHSRYTETEWHSSLHSHYFSEVLIVLNGKGEFLVENERYPIQRNDIIIVNPYVQHTETSSGEFPLWYIVIGINNIKFEKTVQENRSHFIFHEYSGELLPLLKMAIKELNENKWGSDAALKRLAEMILIQIYRDQKFTLIPVENKSVGKDSALIKDFIDKHFKEQLSLDDISDKVHLDKFYIIHTFKQNFDTTPMNYLMKKRIDNARNLLENTEYQISEISLINGFTSQSYFNQAFKKEVGMTPMKYRKKYRHSS
ncbi:AraC family transcriptional regulator [Vagococcus elongatus]|uniref:AraC family transcriptional regulator n=1 Tax=Vagococcus elongatus TaxID=180344 RepID=A0A430B5S2_9ENTE|nr:AraC family transcriptional regulator [Vagococcus elongatus]RSU15648.1 AraC family transcriptional regulator [Vagococcus elongatus]